MSKRSEPDSDLKAPDALVPDLKRAKTVDNEDGPTLGTVIDDSTTASSSTTGPAQPSISKSPSEARPSRRSKRQDVKKSDWRSKRAAQREPWNTPRESTGNADSEEKKERLAKRKCAVLIGFCGTGYSGMQV